jgi:tetratricopeptide (TPR) repeat protein
MQKSQNCFRQAAELAKARGLLQRACAIYSNLAALHVQNGMVEDGLIAYEEARKAIMQLQSRTDGIGDSGAETRKIAFAHAVVLKSAARLRLKIADLKASDAANELHLQATTELRECVLQFKLAEDTAGLTAATEILFRIDKAQKEPPKQTLRSGIRSDATEGEKIAPKKVKTSRIKELHASKLIEKSNILSTQNPQDVEALESLQRAAQLLREARDGVRIERGNRRAQSLENSAEARLHARLAEVLFTIGGFDEAKRTRKFVRIYHRSIASTAA